MGIFSAIAGLFGYHPEEDALNASKDIISQGYDTAAQSYQPYVTAGTNALTKYLDATGQGNSAQGITDFKNSPIYKLLQDSLGIGQAGVLADSAGSLNSGNTLRALSDYSSNQANKAFGEYINPLASTASTGYDASGRVADLGVNKAGSLANIRNQLGQVQGANSIWGGLDSLTSDLIGGAGFLSGSGGSNPLSALASKLGFGGGGGKSAYVGLSGNGLY